MTHSASNSNASKTYATDTNVITPAQIEWRCDDNGHTVPVSRQFGDVYYSLVDGLAESRYVFVEHNQLAERFQHCVEKEENFTIAELGFGTGLNFLATWQLWQQTLQSTEPSSTELQTKRNKAQLHFVSFEKYPLNKADFARSLSPWKESEPALAKLIERLIDHYPTLVAGCHRLSFFEDNLTLDLWLGDACDNLAKLNPLAKVDAWFLDGFAPSCNESLWAEQIFAQINRLSGLGTTVSTFSCAGVVKRGLKDIGFQIAKVKGFGRKREMLTAINSSKSLTKEDPKKQPKEQFKPQQVKPSDKSAKIAVVGAGISGLMTAWSLANRGYQVCLMDKIAPLAGASGNPRGLLAPKMTPIHHVDEHLHSIGYLYSSRLFRQMSHGSSLQVSKTQTLEAQTLETPILEKTGAMDLLLKANITAEKINAYPADFACVLDNNTAREMTGLDKQDLAENQFLPQAGLINPQALAKRVLQHPNIDFQQAHVVKVTEQADKVQLMTVDNKQLEFAHLVICLAYESCQLDKRIFNFRKIRGQLSWFTPTTEQLTQLPKLPLKYGGYCAVFTNNRTDKQTTQFLLGASFVRNDTDSTIRDTEHQDNRHKLVTAIPQLDTVIPTDSSQWQARVGIRSQTPDYHPLVGQVGDSQRTWTLSGMGAKGYAFAPICAEVLADMMTETIPPVSSSMLEKLSVNRKRLQVKLTP